MDQGIKKDWVAALRSGDYLRGTGELRTKSNLFCCLGVLCNLHAQAHPEIAAPQWVSGRYLGVESYLPREVREWAGLESRNPEVLGDFRGGRVSLSTFNDSGHSFSEIADAIENHL